MKPTSIQFGARISLIIRKQDANTVKNFLRQDTSGAFSKDHADFFASGIKGHPQFVNLEIETWSSSQSNGKEQNQSGLSKMIGELLKRKNSPEPEHPKTTLLCCGNPLTDNEFQALDTFISRVVKKDTKKAALREKLATAHSEQIRFYDEHDEIPLVQKGDPPIKEAKPLVLQLV